MIRLGRSGTQIGMTQEQVFAFLLFSLVAAGTPGPSNVLLTATGANVGVVRGLPALFGVAFGMGFMMFIVALGLGGLVLDRPAVLRALNWVGSGFLLWLAWRIATAGRTEASKDARPVGFVGAAAFQWVNPKSWLVCVSAVGAYLQAGTDGAFFQSVVFAMVFVAASLPACFPWLAFGAAMQRLLRGDRALRTFNVAMGALLAGSILLFLQ